LLPVPLRPVHDPLAAFQFLVTAKTGRLVAEKTAASTTARAARRVTGRTSSDDRNGSITAAKHIADTPNGKAL
jgi:hypothetical protein